MTLSDVVEEAGTDFERWLENSAKLHERESGEWRSSIDELLSLGLLRWNGTNLSIACGAEKKVVYSAACDLYRTI